MPEQSITVLCFGPLGERLGKRENSLPFTDGMTVLDVITLLEANDWLEMGLTAAINGQRVAPDSVVSLGDEVALLPPVSGG